MPEPVRRYYESRPADRAAGGRGSTAISARPPRMAGSMSGSRRPGASARRFRHPSMACSPIASDMTLLDIRLDPARSAACSIAASLAASLDHALWFHRPCRADEWLLYAQDSPSLSGSRGFSRGLIFGGPTARSWPRWRRRGSYGSAGQKKRETSRLDPLASMPLVAPICQARSSMLLNHPSQSRRRLCLVVLACLAWLASSPASAQAPAICGSGGAREAGSRACGAIIDNARESTQEPGGGALKFRRPRALSLGGDIARAGPLISAPPRPWRRTRPGGLDQSRHDAPDPR